MSSWDLSNYLALQGGVVPAGAADQAGDFNQKLKWLVDRMNEVIGTSDVSPTPDTNGSLIERIARLQTLVPQTGGVVRNARDWAGGAGYEYWLGNIVGDLGVAAAATDPSGLPGWSWTLSGTTNFATLTGNLFASGTGSGGQMQTTSALLSPRIFGGYDFLKMAETFLGQTPTKLVLEVLGRFVTAGNNDTSAGFGLATGNVAADAAGSAGMIVSDGTNFRLVSDNGSDAGPAVDTNTHLWRVEYGATNTEWFQDGISQGTISTETGIWPCAFLIKRASANNAYPFFTRVYAQV